MKKIVFVLFAIVVASGNLLACPGDDPSQGGGGEGTKKPPIPQKPAQ